MLRSPWLCLLPALALLTAPGCSLPLLVDAVRARLGAEENAGPREIRREELNYRLVSPGLPWVEIPPAHINDEASLVLMRTEPTAFFMIIAEPATNAGLGSEGLTEVVRGMLQSRFPDGRLGPVRGHAVNGVAGQRFDATMSIDGEAFAYSYWVAAAGGHYLQLIAWTQEGDAAALRGEFDALLAGFHLLDPMAGEVAAGQPFGSHRSARHGYGLQLEGTPWVRWDDLAETAAAADSGGLRAQAAFLVIPFEHPAGAPSAPALAAALLSSMSIAFPDPAVQDAGVLRPHDLAFRRLRHQREVDGTPFWYTLQIVAGEQVSLLVAVWSARDQAHADLLADELMPALRLETPDLAAEPETPRARRSQASLHNGLGLYLFRTEQYGPAAAAFERALALAPDEQTYLTNAVDALNRQRAHARAVALLDAQAERHGQAPAVRARRAWHLRHAGRHAEALTAYRALFADGHGDDEDRRSFVELLVGAGLWDEALALLADAAERSGRRDLQLEHARLLQRRGDHQAAIDALEPLHRAAPDDVEVALVLAASYQERDRPDEVLAITHGLLAREVAAASVHQARALALARLERLPEAKAELERAVALEPGNAALQEDLALLSALLGEGDNSSLKAPVAALPLPPALATRLDALRDAPAVDGHGASYLYHVRLRELRRGQPPRRTLYQCLRVVDAAAAARHSTLTFDFDPLAEQLFVNALEVRDAAGAVVARGDPATYYVVDRRDSGPQSHARTLHLPVPRLGPGHSVCLTLSSRGLQPLEQLPFERALLAGPLPARLVGLVLYAEPATLRSAQAQAPPPTAVDGGQAWVLEDVPALVWEPQLQPVERFAPVVWAGDADARWDAEVQAYLQRIAPVLVEEDAVRQLAASLAPAGARGDALLAALARHVRENTTYKAIVFGRRGRDPVKPSVTLARRYGDCKDHAVLLRALLRARGVAAELALVHTQAELREDLPSLDQFDHMIVWVPGRGGGRFVDTTDKGMPALVAAPLGLAGRRALILDPRRPRLVEIHGYGRNAAPVQVAREVQLVDGDLLEVRERVQLTGLSAAGVRQALAQLDVAEHAQWAQALLARELPGASVGRFAVQGLDAPEAGLTLELDYRLPGQVSRGADQVLRVRTADPWARHFLQAPAVPARRTPFEVPVPVHLDSTTTLQPPAGYRAASARPARDDGTGPFGEFRAQHRVEAGAPRSSLRARVQPGHFAAADYARYRTFFERAVQAGDREWILQPAP